MRNRTFRYIDLEFFGLEDTIPCAGFPVCNESVEDALRLTEHLEIRFTVKVGDRGDARPPTTTGIPRARHRSIISIVSKYCGSMPPVMTRSAHSRSLSSSASMFRSTSRIVHVDGSNAATVIRPSGAVG